MGYDMFVQRFENGDAAAMSRTAFREVWEPHVDSADQELDRWHIRAVDAGEADVFARVDGETFDCLMISRFSNGAILDLLVDFIAAADAVVLPPGCPTLLAHDDQRRHLPEELREDALVVGDGATVERILREN